MSKRIEYSEFYKWTENTRINPQIDINANLKVSHFGPKRS